MSWTTDRVRSAFLAYFQRNGHEVVASGPVIAPNDPTLMFANAGMVQFKDVFTGKETRDYQRAASSQKCIRISGKHNDLENVGPSPRHHTFFEMLGNFSFGDYFKERAIELAWGFIQELGLPEERLCVTYFKGEDGVAADEEARAIWKRVSGLPDERIIGCGAADNFWSMGDTGPCGPCSEIHYFQGPEPDVRLFGEEQTAEGYGWVEIWNLVFMQFDRAPSGELSLLPAPSIDTGMGLERIVAVLQGKTSNYDTDVLRGLVETAADIAGKSYSGSMNDDDVSLRVIADHSRLAAFLLAEGVMPDANGREYVLRRVMRRAIRHGHRLGIERPFLHRVALRVTELMGDQYPELREKTAHIAAVCEQEEVRFRRTIERGLSLLEDRFAALEAEGQRLLSGQDAFKLYDTYGFPLDLTEVICAERGLVVDSAGYEAELQAARDRTRFRGVEQAVLDVYREAREALASATAFVGYERGQDEVCLAFAIVDGAAVKSVSAGQQAELVFARTPFYAQAGGQVGDTGTITSASGEAFVSDTVRPLEGLSVHRCRIERGTLVVGENCRLSVDESRRRAIARNHSATHLLHWSLRQVLGEHAQQKGSWVDPERLRFDFTHGQPVTPEQLERIEDLVNERILLNAPVQTEELSIDEAKGRGAMMLFGEKYGARVRVLSMAESVELCGGTHARRTGDIGLLKVLSEQGVAAGVRRITAVTGRGAFLHLRQVEQALQRAAALAKSTALELPQKLDKMLATERQLSKQVAELSHKLATGGAGASEASQQARQVGDVSVLSVRSDVTDRALLRQQAEQLRDRLGDAIVLVGSVEGDKAQLVLTVSKSLTKRYAAGKLIRPIAERLGGSGGGRPDMAQAGGSQVAELDAALESLYDLVAEA